MDFLGLGLALPPSMDYSQVLQGKMHAQKW